MTRAAMLLLITGESPEGRRESEALKIQARTVQSFIAARMSTGNTLPLPTSWIWRDLPRKSQ